MSIEKNIDIFQDDLHIKLVGFVIGALIIGITCFYDDVKGAKALVKLVAQIAAGIVLVNCGIRIDYFSMPFFDIPATNTLFYDIFSILWVVGITNAMNLIDGLDGLSTGINYFMFIFANYICT